MNLRVWPFLFALSSAAFSQSVFLPENGKYNLTNVTMLDSMDKQGLDWVSVVPEKTIIGATYKILPNQNEYRIKDWFKRDWYALQDMFKFKPLVYMNHFQASTLNEAKRKQYARFQFDTKKGFHKKTITTPSEWGGLTHPPVKTLSMPLEKYDDKFAPVNYKQIKSAYFDANFQREVDAASDSQLTFGNTLHVLADHKAWEEKVRLIKNARETIFMSSLAWACDKSTKVIADLLIAKKREGVDVRVMTDSTISMLLGYKSCPKYLRAGGVPVIETNDFLKYNKKSIYHTKVLVTDMSEAIAGGQNMIDADGTSRGTDFKNRDIDLYMKGPMASEVTRAFIVNWTYHRELQGNPSKIESMESHIPKIQQILKREVQNGQRGIGRYSQILSSPETRMKGVCRFVNQNPWKDGHTITKAYLKLLGRVQNHLVITDPIKSDTLSPSTTWNAFEYYNKLHLAVQNFMKSGKRLDYITTSTNMTGNENVAIMNEKIAQALKDKNPMAANRFMAILLMSNKFYGGPHFKNLIEDYVPYENTHVWLHMSFMHSKVFYFDRIVASVGSLNFQHNATDQAYESTSICMDENLNRELDRILVQDMINSVPLIYSR